jgi:putative spermidine/putrescine transport system substrate-binding protein
LSVVAELTRRELLKGGAATTCFYVASRAEKELGLKILAEFAPNYTMKRLVVQQPAAFDILSGFNFLIDPCWPAGNLQPVEIAKIARWQEISPLLKLGKAAA